MHPYYPHPFSCTWREISFTPTKFQRGANEHDEPILLYYPHQKLAPGATYEPHKGKIHEHDKRQERQGLKTRGKKQKGKGLRVKNDEEDGKLGAHPSS